MKLVELKCKNCGSKLSAPEMETGIKVVSCKHCLAIYALDNQDPIKDPIEEPVLEPKRRGKVRAPKNFSVKRTESSLEIRQQWSSPGSVVVFSVLLVVEVLAFIGFLVAVYYMDDRAFPAMSFLLSLGFLVAIGFTLAWMLNSTYIRVAAGNLAISHRPIPGIKKSFMIKSAVQFYVMRKFDIQDSNVQSSYDLYALSKKGNRRCILPRLETARQALYVEQQIERFLNIEDEHVDGEI